jgi:hypothetical protein
MTTTAATTNALAISQIIYYTDNGANGVPANPPFIPVNNPGTQGGGISYGGVPTVTGVAAPGAGYAAGVAETNYVGPLVPGPMNGSGLQVTLTVNASGQVTAAVPVPNTGTGYITGDQVAVLGGAGGTSTCILTVTSNANNEQDLIDANKAAQLDECQNLMSFNPTTDQAYAVVQNGSNVIGAGEIAIDAITNPLVQGANTFQATVVPTAADPANTPATFTWVANGAGLTNDAGAAVGGQPTQRTFTTTAAGQLTITCTVTMTAGAGGVGQGSFTMP